MADLVNPRYQQPATRTTPNKAQRTQLRTALLAIVAALPTDQPTVSMHDLTAQLRAATPAIPPDLYDGNDVAAFLVAAGLTVQ